MEQLNIHKYTKADGTIDFDLLYTEDMSIKTQQAIIKIEHQKKKPTGVLSNEKMLERDIKLAERKMPFVVYNAEQKERIKKAKKEKAKEEQEFTEMVSDRKSLDVAVKEDDLMENEIINRKNKSLETLNQSEIMNTFNVYNKYGKSKSMVIANTKIGRHITENAIWNFGSIGDYNVDCVPRSRVTCKGTEITTINIYDKQNRNNKQLISRRFCSKVLMCWSKMVDMQYSSKDKDKPTSMSLWCTPIEYQGIDSKCYQYFINGEITTQILKDILFVLHNKPYNANKISPQLEYVINRRIGLRKRNPNDIINDMKNRLCYTYQTNNIVWGYPKVSPQYIIKLINTLKSGEFGTLLKEYDTQIMVPIICNLKKYPLKMTAYHKPKDNADHKKQGDDYNISQYLYNSQEM
jgi:hypothetical protein